MSDDLTTRLAALRALEAAATPGPWVGDRHDGTVKYLVQGPGRNYGVDAADDPATVLVVNHKDGSHGFLGPRGDANEELTLRGRNAFPALVAVATAAAMAVEGGKVAALADEFAETLGVPRCEADDGRFAESIHTLIAALDDLAAALGQEE